MSRLLSRDGRGLKQRLVDFAKGSDNFSRMGKKKGNTNKARIAALEKGRQRLAFDMTKEKDPKRRASMKKHGENMTEDIRRLRKK